MKIKFLKAVTFIGIPPYGAEDEETFEFVTSEAFDNAYVRVLAMEFAITHGWTDVHVSPVVRRVFQHVVEPGVTS